MMIMMMMLLTIVLFHI